MSLELARPRDLGALLRDSLRVYFGHFPTFFLLAAIVVVPVDAAVLGLGLGQLHGGYDNNPSTAFGVFEALTRLLVVGPLVAVMTLYALLDVADGSRPRLGATIVRGLETFRAVFWPVLAAVALEIVTMPLLLLGLVLYVRLFFVPQLVTVGRRRGREALEASFELTRGFGWRVAGVLIVTNLVFGAVGGLVAVPIDRLAKSADSQAIALAGTTLAEVLIAAPAGLVAALLYYDLRARRGQGAL